MRRGHTHQSHLTGLKDQLWQLLSHLISPGLIAYTLRVVLAGRLIGLLTVRERTATLLRSHCSVSKRHFPLFHFHEEDGRLFHLSPSAPRLDLSLLLAAHKVGGGGAPSSDIARRHASSHMPACLPACRQRDRRMAVQPAGLSEDV